MTGNADGQSGKIDVIASVDYGYRTLWAERHYLLRLALIPLAVKIVCLGILLALGWEQNPLRLALVMLPSALVEGWMLAHIVRLVFWGQRWPFVPTGDPAQDLPMLMMRARAIAGGAVFYALIKHAQAGLMFVVQWIHMRMPQTPGQDPDALIAMLAIAILVFGFWAFRWAFLYVPAAAGVGMPVLLRPRGGFGLSLQLIAIWLVCIVPPLILTLFLVAGVVPPPGGEVGADMIQRSAATVFQAIGDTLMAVLATLAVAHALRNMLEAPGPRR